MMQSTHVPMSFCSSFEDDLIPMGHEPKSLQKISGTALPDIPNDTAPDKSEASRRMFTAPVVSAAPREFVADSVPLQIWEGTVISVDYEAGTMQVLLDAKVGQIPRHTAEIDLDDVSAQDHDLVCPGAVFYLTLYKRTIPSVENIEELRFRRRPSWTEAQIKQIEKDAALLLSKTKILPTAT